MPLSWTAAGIKTGKVSKVNSSGPKFCPFGQSVPGEIGGMPWSLSELEALRKAYASGMLWASVEGESGPDLLQVQFHLGDA